MILAMVQAIVWFDNWLPQGSLFDFFLSVQGSLFDLFGQRVVDFSGVPIAARVSAFILNQRIWPFPHP